MGDKNYVIYDNGRFFRLNDFLKDKMRIRDANKNPDVNKRGSISGMYQIWSARLSTGLFGTTNCPSGNRGPKSSSEVLLATGNDGLVKLIELGFITCPVCKPENFRGVWNTISFDVQDKYGTSHNIHSLEDFTNKDILTYDARRLNWEELIPLVGAFPGRIYVPQGLDKYDLMIFGKRLRTLHKDIPQVGYLDKGVQPWQFVIYDKYV